MPATDELSPAELAALRDQCSLFLAGHGPPKAADLLASIPGDTATDYYGEGGVVAELEVEIAGLLGKPAAVFLPSGTMAQQSVLRVHADRRQRIWAWPKAMTTADPAVQRVELSVGDATWRWSRTGSAALSPRSSSPSPPGSPVRPRRQIPDQ